jgi:microcystin-dependent protein
VTLTTQQLPIHSHVLAASNATGSQPSPAGGVWAVSTLELYSTDAPTLAMSATTTLPSGGSQPHDNVPPYQVVNFIIALYGIYPSQN